MQEPQQPVELLRRVEKALAGSPPRRARTAFQRSADAGQGGPFVRLGTKLGESVVG